MGVTRNELARHLRQCVELGQGALFLEGMRRSEALESVAPGEPSMRPSLPTNVPSSAPPELQVLRDEVLSCTRCRLHRGRTQAVFADGNPSARLVVVGEAPGANEDRTGLPFVGQAGKLLDLMLSSVGLSREESVYICNVIKCRPPGNRDPQPDEISACSSYLRRQLQIVRPEAVLTVGAFASKLLTSDRPCPGQAPRRSVQLRRRAGGGHLPPCCPVTEQGLERRGVGGSSTPQERYGPLLSDGSDRPGYGPALPIPISSQETH